MFKRHREKTVIRYKFKNYYTHLSRKNKNKKGKFVFKFNFTRSNKENNKYNFWKTN